MSRAAETCWGLDRWECTGRCCEAWKREAVKREAVRKATASGTRTGIPEWAWGRYGVAR
jgi:hypothetical protein